MKLNPRIALTGLALAAFAFSLVLLVNTQAQLHRARAELHNAAASGQGADPETTSPTSNGSAEPDAGVSPEILRLRAEVTRLSRRKQELESGRGRAVAPAHEVSLVASNAVPLPPGYIRKAAAQNRGFSSPEATLETLLWALQQQDTNRLLACFTEEAGAHIRDQLATPESEKEFRKRSGILPGFAFGSRRAESDTTLEVGLEIVPGMPPAEVKLELNHGEWKINSPF